MYRNSALIGVLLITFWLGLFQGLSLKEGRFKDGSSDFTLPRAGSELGKCAGHLPSWIAPTDTPDVFRGDHIFKGDRELFSPK
jgi:hypothetical protein